MVDSIIVAAGADPGRWQAVQKALGGQSAVAFAIDLRGTLDLVAREKPAVLVLCSDLLDAKVEECLEHLERRAPSGLRVILLDGDHADRALRTLEPATAERILLVKKQNLGKDLLPTVKSLLAPRGSRASCRCANKRKNRADADLADFPAYRTMVTGSSPGMRKALETIRRVAGVDVTVMLHGETGTGKELFARRVHCMSGRASAPFRAVSLPAVPSELFESVLFGHERGSFTGAVNQNAGAFEQACGGTLFLDEVSSLALESQPKLLRAIQEKEIERVGARGPVSCDVRIVAATNVDLAESVASQCFREDLYHRLSVVTVEIPPLRERREDIAPLVAFFVDKYTEQFRCERREICADAMRALERWEWTGNVRELENRVQKALLLAQGAKLTHEDFFADNCVRAAGMISLYTDRERSLAEVERAYIEHVLERVGGNQSKAAQILGIDRKTLRAKLQKTVEPAAGGVKAGLRSIPA